MMTAQILGQLSADKMAERFARNATDKHLLIGPVVTREDEPHPYCLVCGSDTERFWCDLVYLPEGSDDRSLFMIALANQARGFVVQAFDNELHLAEMCHTIWPCDKTKRILDGVRQDFAQAD